MDDQISREVAIETLWAARERLEKSRITFLAEGLPSAAYDCKTERNRIEEDIELLRDLPAAEPQIKCVAKITLNEEQVQDAVEKAKREILAALPRWRPVSEMPEENMWTICQNNAGAMMIGKYDIEFGWMFPAYFDGIVAWQPCPAPFKGGSHMNEVNGPAADADQ